LPETNSNTISRTTELEQIYIRMFGEQTTKRRYLINLDFSFYQHNFNNIAQKPR
jgi:hypothetical protein